MQYVQGKTGRVFLAKIEHNDNPVDEINKLAKKEDVKVAAVFLLGALAKASMVTGPKNTELPPVPIWNSFDDGREIIGTGTLVKDNNGEPSLHLHLAAGRNDAFSLGCLRNDAETYLTVEAIIIEIANVNITRVENKGLGIKVLNLN